LWLTPCRVRVEEGRLLARPSGHGAGGPVGPIGAMAGANAWAVVPADCAGLPAGAEVEVRLLTAG
ncbi:MAG: hypothetical protein ACRDJO_09485, partial [Actinomycetota bacterium]